MKFSRNPLQGKQIDKLVYADLFDSPLKIGQKYFCLPGREKLIGLRKKREKYSLEKEKIAVAKTNFLKRIPSVEAIFLTGSVAVGNAKKDADIDLMIVTTPNTLWITRLVVYMLLKSLRLLRSPKDQKDLICPNIFVDLNYLRISDENIYTAHEILQAKLLFDRGGIYTKWLKENEWTRKYCHAELVSASLANARILKQVERSRNKFGMTLILFELFAFISQYLYMKKKITHERVGWGYAFFHPNNLSKTIPEKYRQRLLKYTEK